jgi:CheY-like chemotaxis protein
VAHTGRDGLERAGSFSPAIVLCDIGLPRMDGFEVARRSRAHPVLRAVQFVALNGYAQPEDVERAQAADFDRPRAVRSGQGRDAAPARCGNARPDGAYRGVRSRVRRSASTSTTTRLPC